MDKILDKHFGNFRGGGMGGTPLVITQEDCLVFIIFGSSDSFYETWCFSVKNVQIWIK